jgi:putative copper export protein
MIKIIKKMKIKKINLYNIITPMKNNIRYLFSFPLVLTNLNVNVNDSDPMITQLAYGVFLLSLVSLFCFISVLGYIIAYYLVEKGNYENRYPKFKRIINSFKGITLTFLIIDGLLCLTCLILLVVFSFLFIIK